MIRRIIATLLVASIASTADAQVNAPVYRGTGGSIQEAQGVFCLDYSTGTGQSCGGNGGAGGGDASAANQTSVQAVAGSDASKAMAVQGVTGGKPIGVTGPATDTQLRATPLPVATGGLTDTQLRANPVPVSGTVTATGTFYQPDVANSGTIAGGTANATYSVTLPSGSGMAGFTLTGLSASGAVLTAEGTNDLTNWYTINIVSGGTGGLSSTVAADGQFRLNVAGRRGVRLRVSTTGSGTITIASNVSTATGEVALSAPLPPGENHGQEVGGNQTTIAVAQTVTASSAYASGNAVGGLMTLAGAARISGALGGPGTSGMMQSILVASKSLQTAQIDVVLFNANPTASTCTDKTAFVLAAADFDKVIGAAHVADWTAGSTGSFGQAQNMAMPYALASATTIYACAITRGTPTFASTSDISLIFRPIRN